LLMGRRKRWRNQNFDGDEGIDYVCCRICGDHRRVISGRHLSKHDTDRETYMQENDLSPDELARAAQNYFGSWRNALHAAGIDPDLHLRRYKRHKRSVNSVI
jgi:hypothetical protein